MSATSSTMLSKTEQGMSITGNLVFASVAELVDQGNQFLNEATDAEFEIDCHSMQRIDSAGIALLLEWQRESAKIKKSCSFAGFSDQAQSLISAYRLQLLIADK